MGGVLESRCVGRVYGAYEENKKQSKCKGIEPLNDVCFLCVCCFLIFVSEANA